MGARPLGAKLTRRIARETGQDVERAVGYGGYTFEFRTTDHRHGWWDKKTGEWGWDDDPMHWASCPHFPSAE